jgi:signal transduction histidine kinase
MTIWPRSLIARILILELGAILVAAILLPAIMVSLLQGEVSRYQIRTMTEQARHIAASLTDGAGQLRVHLASDLADTYATPYDGRAYVVTNESAAFMAGSAYAELVPWRAAPRGTTVQPFRAGVFIGVSMPARLGPRPIWIIVTQDEAGPGAILDDVVRAFLWRYEPVLLVVLLLIPLINSVLIRRVVLAVRRVSQQAKTIESHNLDVRLDERGLPSEVSPLAQATNGLLVRLQESFQQQSEFARNVAHELRTPLAALKVQLESVHDRALGARLSKATDRVTHVVSQLHDLAALEAHAEDRFEPFDLVELAQETVSEWAPQILADGHQIELDEPGTRVCIRGNRTLVALALTNLISNALRHTPAGTSIVVKILQSGTISVHDDGPGIASSQPERSTQRYWRADHRRSDSAGLGLSIVRRIVEVHRATLKVESEPNRGACFIMQFASSPDG